MSSTSGTILALAAFLILGGAVAVGAILVILRYGRKRRLAPTCSDCSYDLTAHVDHAKTCPECGRRLDAPDAVIPAGRREPLTTKRWVLLLTVVMIAASIGFTTIINRWVPSLSNYTWNSTWSRPASGGYTEVSVTSSVKGMWRPLPMPAATTIALTEDDGASATLTIARREMLARAVKPDGSWREWPLGEANNATGDAVYAWMTTHVGLEDDAGALRREADALGAYLHAPDNFIRPLPGSGLLPDTIAEQWPGMPFSNNSKTVSQIRLRHVWRIPMLLSPWVILWGLGVVILLVRGGPEKG